MKTRVITSLVVMPIVLAAICYTQTWPLMILGGLVVLVGCLELSKLTSFTQFGGAFYFLVCASVLLLTPSEQLISNNLGWLAALTLCLPVTAFDKAFPAGGLWVSLPFACVILLHYLTAGRSTGLWDFTLILVFLPLWSADIAGILVGMAIGKHLLAPKISPKKTIEGGIGNLLAAVGVAIPLSIWLGYDWTIGLWCGLAIGILGQAGDLFESWLKRRAGVKDSGTILPGHGGVLDRIDSLLFSAPVVCLILVNAPRG